MANRWLQRPFCYQKYLTQIVGRFSLNNTTGTINTAKTTGLGFTVIKAGGVGTYTLTLTDQFPALISATFSLMVVGIPTNGIRIIYGVTPYAGIVSGPLGAITILIFDTSGALAEVSADSEVHFQLNLSNTSVVR